MEQPNTQITSKLSDEIAKLFNLLKSESISGRDVKKTILGLSSNVFHFINDNKNIENKNEAKKELQNIEYEIKEAIIQLQLFKSSKIIESSSPLELFIDFIDKSKKEIQLITIVFGKIVKERLLLSENTEVSQSPPFKEYYFKHFTELVLLSNSFAIFNQLISCINKLRYTLNSSNSYEKIFQRERDESYTLGFTIDLINEIDNEDNFNRINNTLSVFSDIDLITDKKFNVKGSFENNYRRNLTKIYNVFGNTISSVKNSNVEEKFKQVLKTISIESFIHDSIFSDTIGFKALINKEILEPNIKYIVDIFNEKMINFGDYFNDNFHKVQNKEFNIGKMFDTLLGVPNFIDLYLKLYEYNQKSIKYISASLGEQLESYYKSKKENISLEFVFLSYIFLRDLEDNLMTSFTPSNESEDNPLKTNNDNIPRFKNTPFVNNIHNIFMELIQKCSHDELINIIFGFSLKENVTLNKDNDKTEKVIKSKPNKLDNIYKIIKNVKENYDIEFQNEPLKYITFCINNKDEFEDIYKKNLLKKIIYSNLEKFNIDEIECIIQELSYLPDVCLKTNIKILNSYRIGENLSREFNMVYQSSGSKKDIFKNEFMNLKHLPDGICNITPFEYKDGEFLSDEFKSHVSNIKSNFKEYYDVKFDGRILKWTDNLSTIDLAFTNYEDKQITLVVNYKQADLLFLIQYEIQEALDSLIVLSWGMDTSDVVKLPEYTEYNERITQITKSDFIKYLIEKKMFKKTNVKIVETNSDNLLTVPHVEFNSEMKLKRDKSIDIYKMKFKDLQKSRLKNEENTSSKKKEDSLVFFRSDYTQSFIMKACKLRKTEIIEENELFELSKNHIKSRFDLEKSLFATAVEKLVKNEYLSREVMSYETDTLPEVIGYKYVP